MSVFLTVFFESNLNLIQALLITTVTFKSAVILISKNYHVLLNKEYSGMKSALFRYSIL